MTDAQDKRQVALAVSSYLATGDNWMMLWILRSDRPLTAEDRNLIADFIEGKIKLRRGGAPLKHLVSNARTRTLPLRAAGYEVERIKAEARAAGKGKNGLHDMAIELAAKTYGPKSVNGQLKFQEKLRTFMTRPKKVRHAL